MKATGLVELHTAFVFDCDDCGRENFVRAVIFKPTPEELTELQVEHGIDPDDGVSFGTAPDTVTCSHCGSTFRTADAS